MSFYALTIFQLSSVLNLVMIIPIHLQYVFYYTVLVNLETELDTPKRDIKTGASLWEGGEGQLNFTSL